MIPVDLASRLRMLTEASFFKADPPIAALARVREIPAGLPEFTAGQRFVAQIQGAGEDNTFKALIEGRSVTLALPPSVTVGDSVELVVSHVTPQAVFASIVSPPPATETSTAPALSQAGRLIGFLLTGQPPAAALQLNGGAALLPGGAPAPGDGAQLAGRLNQAVSESGLFYEAHQARWLSGQIDTASLQREPQGRASPTAAAPASASPGAPGAAASAATADGLPRSAADATATAVERAAIPEHILPLVHQQLDALATQNIVWQGQVWPGQNMEWEIEDPARDGQEDAAEPYWNTTLRLTLPQLGRVEARLHLTPGGIAMRLVADQPATVAALQSGQQQLADALAAANVPLTGLAAEVDRPR